MEDIVRIEGLTKVYGTPGRPDAHEALRGIDLNIRKGEILALLGPNGAGKTTLISIVCGLVTPSSGRVTVGGHDILRDYRAARRLIGLVPQELMTDPFENVFKSLRFSRGLFGKRPDDAYLEKLLRQLSLWDKRDVPLSALSGGMKRRVLIAKALSHEPRVLFLDEPTAGVDVELRNDMWQTVAGLQADGVTIILTTHYIEEAEAIAERVGVINKGSLLLVEEKDSLMARMGRKQLRIELASPASAIPPELADSGLVLEPGGKALIYDYEVGQGRTGITTLLTGLTRAGLQLRDLHTSQSSLEEIFVGLVREQDR